jgi:hypothetical protein
LVRLAADGLQVMREQLPPSSSVPSIETKFIQNARASNCLHPSAMRGRLAGISSQGRSLSVIASSHPTAVVRAKGKRSSRGGIEAVEAFGQEDHLSWAKASNRRSAKQRAARTDRSPDARAPEAALRHLNSASRGRTRPPLGGVQHLKDPAAPRYFVRSRPAR